MLKNKPLKKITSKVGLRKEFLKLVWSWADLLCFPERLLHEVHRVWL